MESTGIQEFKTLEEQLEELKEEQVQAEKIYRKRMELGALSHDPESLKGLAQTIMERKMKIDDLEAKIVMQNSSDDYDHKPEQEEKTENNEEKGLTVMYDGRNPILRFLQKIMNKLELKLHQLEGREKREPMDWYKQKFEQEMKELDSKKYSEYEQMANSDFSKSTKSPKVKNAHQLFVDKMSGNGAYHTYGENAKNLDVKIKTSHEINQNIQKQIKSDDIKR